jgi:lysozyme
VTVKATRGLNIIDPYLQTDLEAARTAGLTVAPYHFYTGTEPDTGAAQADRFIAAVKNTGYTGHRPGDLPPIFDLEHIDVDPNQGKCPPHVSVDDAKTLVRQGGSSLQPAANHLHSRSVF